MTKNKTPKVTPENGAILTARYLRSVIRLQRRAAVLEDRIARLLSEHPELNRRGTQCQKA